MEYIDVLTWDYIRYCEFFAKNGSLPLGGGVLDQTQNFIEGSAFVISEQEYYKRKRKVIDHG